jgi:hypothetical protein
VALLLIICPGYVKQYAAVIEVQNKDKPSRLKISVSFLKGKLLGFIYWKRVKIVPTHAIQTYRASGNIYPPILNVGTHCSWVSRFTLWLLYIPEKNFSHPLRRMLAGHQSQYAHL